MELAGHIKLLSGPDVAQACSRQRYVYIYHLCIPFPQCDVIFEVIKLFSRSKIITTIPMCKLQGATYTVGPCIPS